MLYRAGTLISILYAVGLLLLGGAVHNKTEKTASSDRIALLDLPREVPGWTSIESEGLKLREQEILRLDEYIRRRYTRVSDGKVVEVYVGYWSTQSGDYQAAKHSPKTCLPSNGWEILDSETRELAASGQVIASLVARFNNVFMLFDYWFFSGEDVYHQEWLALIKIAGQKLIYGRSDGGIVELSTRLNGPEQLSRVEARELLEDFVEAFKPSFTKHQAG